MFVRVIALHVRGRQCCCYLKMSISSIHPNVGWCVTRQPWEWSDDCEHAFGSFQSKRQIIWLLCPIRASPPNSSSLQVSFEFLLVKKYGRDRVKLFTNLKWMDSIHQSTGRIDLLSLPKRGWDVVTGERGIQPSGNFLLVVLQATIQNLLLQKCTQIHCTIKTWLRFHAQHLETNFVYKCLSEQLFKSHSRLCSK